MRICCALFFGLLLPFAMPARESQAGVVSQTVTFSDTQTASGSGTILNAGPTGLVGSVNPFDSSLGTLNSITVVWSVGLTGSGTASSSGGSYSLNLGGTFYVGTKSYGGNGGGNGGGAAPSSALPTLSASVNDTETFLPGQAGQTYDPAILASFTGASPIDLVYWVGNDFTVYSTYTTVDSFTSAMDASVTVTYDYAPVPEPTSFAIGTALFSGLLAVRRRRKE